jgi:hypothetical protein
MVVLYECNVAAGGVAEIPVVPAHEQEAALVSKHLRLEDQDVWYRRGDGIDQGWGHGFSSVMICIR